MKKKTKEMLKWGAALGFLAGATYLYAQGRIKKKKMEQTSSVER